MGVATFQFNGPPSPLDAGGGSIRYGTVSLSATYASGGDSFTPVALGGGHVVALVIGAGAGGVVLVPNLATGVIQAFSAGVEVGAGSDQSANAAQFMAFVV